MGSLHRLLCRVFAGGYDAFVLQGGQLMLVPAVDVRATRDIEPLAQRCSLDEALGKALSRVRDLQHRGPCDDAFHRRSRAAEVHSSRRAAVRRITLAESFGVPEGWDTFNVR